MTSRFILEAPILLREQTELDDAGLRSLPKVYLREPRIECSSQNQKASRNPDAVFRFAKSMATDRGILFRP